MSMWKKSSMSFLFDDSFDNKKGKSVMAYYPKMNKPFKSLHDPEQSEYVCSIDGAYFVPALISGVLMSDIQKHIYEWGKFIPKEVQNWLNDSFAIWFFEEGEFHLYQSWGDKDLETPVLEINSFWEAKSFENEHLVSWRPVLIPTDEYGTLDKTAKADNPNGSLAYGGTCYVDDKEWLPGQSEAIGIDSVVEIRDTGSQPLRWFWWDGVMVSLDTIAQIPLLPLVKNHGVGPICYENYRERRPESHYCW